MKKFASIILLLSTVAFAANADLTDGQQKAIENINRAMAIVDAAWTTSIRGTATNLYLTDTYNTQTGAVSGPSDVWPYTAAIEAQNAILEALIAAKNIDADLYDTNFDKYSERLAQLIDNLEFYRGTFRLSSYATSNKEWKPFAVGRANTRGTANVTGILNVYDDQMWLARELIRAYRITGNKDYLDEAAYLTDYVLEGWDCWRDENGEEYGGITWGPGYNSKHACSNAPIIQPLVWLSEIYKEADEEIETYARNEQNTVEKTIRPRSEYYFDFAEKIYNWQKSKLRYSTGVYWDMMGADNTIIVSRGYRQHVDCGGATGAFISYNTGTMISGAAELYRVTNDPVYQDDLSTSSKASLSQFGRYVRQQGAYEFSTDDTAQNGFNTWFNDVLMRAYVDADPYATNNSTTTGLNSFQITLDYAFDNHNRNNLLPIHLLDGWGNETITKAFHQFAFSAQYAALAKWLIGLESVAGIQATTTDRPSIESNKVYTLNGTYIGDIDTVEDTLTRNIYIVGTQKRILGK